MFYNVTLLLSYKYILYLYIELVNFKITYTIKQAIRECIRYCSINTILSNNNSLKVNH